MKTILFLIILLLFLSYSVYNQSLNIVLTGKDISGKVITMDSVIIKNLNTNVDTMIYAPFKFNLGMVNDIREVNNQTEDIAVFPNPIMEYADIIFTIDKAQRLDIQISSIHGQVLCNTAKTLNHGQHVYRFFPGNQKIYLLNINRKMIKIINNSITKRKECYIEYIHSQDMLPSNPFTLKTNTSDFIYNKGDLLQFTGYAKGYSNSVIYDSPGKDTLYQLVYTSLRDAVLSETGWFGIGNEDGRNENLNKMEEDIYLASTQNLPSMVDLTPNFPPIGNQGNFGTSVAWAVGYNAKTYLDAYDKKTKPTSTSQIYSPKYLFWKIESADKGSGCNGTYFEAALNVLVNDGIATQATVPYSNLGTCGVTDKPTISQNTEAALHKIENYRKIDHTNLDLIKAYLADNRPVIVGAKVGENFVSWETDNVLSDDTETYNGQHAFQALTLCGYDNSRGAFRVINSWNDWWGDQGFIWVDYYYFVNKFAFAGFVMKNQKASSGEMDADGDGDIDNTDNLISGTVDLIGWDLMDEPWDDADPDNERYITYNVYNIGDETAYATDDWAIIYLYYNAYNATNYDIMIFDYYTDDYGDNADHYDLIPDGDESAIGARNFWNNIDIPAGRSVADVLLKLDTDVSNDDIQSFTFTYKIPTTVNGYYYFVMIADAFGVFDEYDEDNNFLFYTAEDLKPLTVTDGVIQNGYKKSAYLKTKAVPEKGDASPLETVRTNKNANTYTPDEISAMIAHEQANGEMQRKAAQFLKSGSATKADRSKCVMKK